MPDYLIIAIVILAIQGIGVSLFLSAFKKIYSSSAIFLVLFVFAFSIYLLEQILYWTSFFTIFPHALFLTVPSTFLFGPLTYLYFTRRSFNWKMTWHFLPFFARYGFMIPFLMLSAERKSNVFLNQVISEPTFTPSLFLALEFVTMLQLGTYLVVNHQFLKNRNGGRQVAWNKRLNFVLGIFLLAWLHKSIFFTFYNLELIVIADKVLIGFMTISILYIFIRIILGSDILKSTISYKKNLLSVEQLEQFSADLEHLMTNEMLFKNRTLRLVDLASRLKITEHQLSQVLSNRFNKNFFEFVNEYRVELAKEFLVDPNHEKYTIEAIGQEVGFNSKSTFNDVFKRKIGKTPSEYKKSERISTLS